MNEGLDPTKVTGIFGGSFDPVHIGHVRIAEELIELGKVEQVLFIPAAQAPHKLQYAPVSAEHRLEMLKLATVDSPNLSVCDYEIRKGGVSYTIHTIKYFLSILGDNLRMVLGMDSLRDLHKWYCSQELVRLCPIITYRRPGSPDVHADELTAYFGDDSTEQLLANVIDAELFETSSTEIRQRCHSGKSTEGLLAPEVRSYIIEKKLYT